MNQAQYDEAFGLKPEDKGIREKALENAHDFRKFEIDLYWKRAAYFWTLITVAFAGYFAILGTVTLHNKEYLAYIVGCVGLLFTWAWFLVNRGSKLWQENWENHVDMLEDKVTGPLYKTVLHRPPEKRVLEKLFIGPLPISVSKTNQWVSLFTLLIWYFLILNALDVYPLTIMHLYVGVVTIGLCILIFWKGRTFPGGHIHIADQRVTGITTLAEIEKEALK